MWAGRGLSPGKAGGSCIGGGLTLTAALQGRPWGSQVASRLGLAGALDSLLVADGLRGQTGSQQPWGGVPRRGAWAPCERVSQPSGSQALAGSGSLGGEYRQRGGLYGGRGTHGEAPAALQLR